MLPVGGSTFPAAEILPPCRGAMNEFRVECYAGHRADERPLRFVLSGRPYEVCELAGRWYSPEASYFRVLADDGNFYVLRHDETQGTLTLDGFRAPR
jgi:hypothetical protein